MDDVISKYEAQYIMRGLGRGEEFEHLLYHVLPTLAEEWAAKGGGRVARTLLRSPRCSLCLKN